MQRSQLQLKLLPGFALCAGLDNWRLAAAEQLAASCKSVLIGLAILEVRSVQSENRLHFMMWYQHLGDTASEQLARTWGGCAGAVCRVFDA